MVVRKENEKIAIKIETGKSDFMRNIRQDLSAKYDRIIVVATNKSVFEEIEKRRSKFLFFSFSAFPGHIKQTGE